MPRAPWESQDYSDSSEPHWQPEKAGPEYHMYKNAPPRCTLCGMAMTWGVDDIGPLMRCHNRSCKLYQQPERP